MNQAHSLTLILLLACVLMQAAFVTCATDEARLNELGYLRQVNKKGVIPFTSAKFEDFLEAAPRSYGIIVAMTAARCQICPSLIRELTRVSGEYYSLPTKKTARKPLFFAKMQLSEKDQPFLMKYQLRHVPMLYYFAPGQGNVNRLDENSPDNYPVQRIGIGANTIREFVNARTSARLQLMKGNYKVPFVGTVRRYRGIILLLVSLLAIAAVYTKTYKRPMFWFGLVVLVYVFSVGGGHYSWIHDVPFVFIDKEGVTQYMAAGSRSQYVAEGFFVSATCVSISVLIILMNELPSMVRDKDVQTFAGVILFILTLFAITVLLLLYYLKMPQYLQYSEM